MHLKYGKYLAIASITLLALAGTVALTNVNKPIYNLSFSTAPYSLQFSKTSYKIAGTPSTINVTTSESNTIVFSCHNISASDSNNHWGIIKNGGEFYNAYDAEGNHNALHQLESIKIIYDDSDGELAISYGWKTDDSYNVSNQRIASNTTYSFDSTAPKYFKISNLGQVTIEVESISLTYACGDDSQDAPINPEHVITVNDNHGGSYDVSVREDGSYDLGDLSREGYTFEGFVDDEDNDFSQTGTVGALSSDKTIYATWAIDGTDTFDKLKTRARAGASEIKITADFDIEEVVAFYGDVTIYCEEDHTLTRRADFDDNSLFTLNGTSLTFDGINHNGTLTLDGNKENVEVSSMGGGLVRASGANKTINVNGANFVNSKVVDKNGGAFHIGNSATLNLTKCIIEDNDAILGVAESGYYGGGAIYLSGGILNINEVASDSVVIRGNTSSKNGGAIAVMGTSTLNLDGGTFNSNGISNTGSYGGAIYIGNSSATTTIQNTSFIDNFSYYKGGAIYATANVNLSIESSLFDGNHSGYGGAICLNSSNELDITCSDFINNYAQYGNSTSYGGAIYASGGTITLTGTNEKHVLFDGNTAKNGHGGTFYLIESSSLTAIYLEVINSSCAGSSKNGGVFFVSASDLNLENSIFGKEGNGNSASNNGGVMYIVANCNVEIRNCTACYNTANIGGFATINGANTTMTIYSITANHNSAATVEKGYFVSVRTNSTIYTTVARVATDIDTWDDVFRKYKDTVEITIKPTKEDNN